MSEQLLTAQQIHERLQEDQSPSALERLLTETSRSLNALGPVPLEMEPEFNDSEVVALWLLQIDIQGLLNELDELNRWGKGPNLSDEKTIIKGHPSFVSKVGV
jgi:hypothetical protein